MGTIEEGEEIQVFHPDHWPEPFRATVVQFEDEEHVLVCALDPVVGADGEELFDEGEYLVVEIKHIVNHDG